jgi:hypothetical protein
MHGGSFDGESRKLEKGNIFGGACGTREAALRSNLQRRRLHKCSFLPQPIAGLEDVVQPIRNRSIPCLDRCRARFAAKAQISTLIACLIHVARIRRRRRFDRAVQNPHVIDTPARALWRDCSPPPIHLDVGSARLDLGPAHDGPPLVHVAGRGPPAPRLEASVRQRDRICARFSVQALVARAEVLQELEGATGQSHVVDDRVAGTITSRANRRTGVPLKNTENIPCH